MSPGFVAIRVQIFVDMSGLTRIAITCPNESFYQTDINFLGILRNCLQNFGQIWLQNYRPAIPVPIMMHDLMGFLQTFALQPPERVASLDIRGVPIKGLLIPPHITAI